jgi:hypothetical protein
MRVNEGIPEVRNPSPRQRVYTTGTRYAPQRFPNPNGPLCAFPATFLKRTGHELLELRDMFFDAVVFIAVAVLAAQTIQSFFPDNKSGQDGCEPCRSKIRKVEFRQWQFWGG